MAGSILQHFSLRAAGMVGLVKERIFGLPLRADTAALPTAGASYRGGIVVVRGSAGVAADKIRACLMKSDGTYAWAHLLPISGVSVVSPLGSVSVVAGANGSASQSCGAGQTLVSGGCLATPGLHLLNESRPAGTTSWQCGSRNTSAVTGTLAAYAVCLDTPVT